MLAISKAVAPFRAANSLGDNREALSQIQDIMSQLGAIDREAAAMEGAADTGVENPEEDARYEALYEMAKELVRASNDIVDQYELASDPLENMPFDSNLIGSALVNA